MTSTRSTRTGALAATSAEAALRFANELARACAGALGEGVAGVILHGSLTLGDYLPGRSDVDLLVVIDHPPSDARLAALAEAMASGRAEAPGPVDLRLVTRQVAAWPTPAPPLEAYLRLTPASGVRVEERRHPAERDLAVELSVCRAHGRCLLGAAPAKLLGEVPDRWVVAAGDAQLADWQAIGDDPPYAELTVLTACRVWRFTEKRRHASKAAAAQWAALLIRLAAVLVANTVLAGAVDLLVDNRGPTVGWLLPMTAAALLAVLVASRWTPMVGAATGMGVWLLVLAVWRTSHQPVTWLTGPSAQAAYAAVAATLLVLLIKRMGQQGWSLNGPGDAA